jgi:nucleoside-diphosphate-sugar epimerase
VIGGGNGWWSFVHIEDAAAATALAIERGAAGNIYNPTFPGFPVVVGRRMARSGVFGNGRRAPRPQKAVQTAG